MFRNKVPFHVLAAMTRLNAAIENIQGKMTYRHEHFSLLSESKDSLHVVTDECNLVRKLDGIMCEISVHHVQLQASLSELSVTENDVALKDDCVEGGGHQEWRRAIDCTTSLLRKAWDLRKTLKCPCEMFGV